MSAHNDTFCFPEAQRNCNEKDDARVICNLPHSGEANFQLLLEKFRRCPERMRSLSYINIQNGVGLFQNKKLYECVLGICFFINFINLALDFRFLLEGFTSDNGSQYPPPFGDNMKEIVQFLTKEIFPEEAGYFVGTE